MTQPTEPRVARLTNLARTLKAIPHIERTADCGCPRCRAHTWTQIGYPTSTLGDEILTQTADLPDHERPTNLVFVADLPTVLGGAKVQRQALRDQLESRT